MKNPTILSILVAIIIAFAGCNREETSSNERGNVAHNVKNHYNILCKEKIPPLVKELVHGTPEIFCDYIFTDCQRVTPKPQHLRFDMNTYPNTYHLGNPHELKLTIEDSCRFEQSERQQVHYITRLIKAASGDSAKTNSTPPVQRVVEYTIHPHQSQPITIIRPYVTECDPIPLCYYHDLEVEWNEDVFNNSGVGIIIEWNGKKMLDPYDNVRVVGIDFVDDLGSVVLDDAIFDNIPDGALVYMWLFRFDVATIEGENNVEYSLRDILGDEDLLEELLEADPEFTFQLRNIFVLNGSVAMLPFFLIRNLQ